MCVMHSYRLKFRRRSAENPSFVAVLKFAVEDSRVSVISVASVFIKNHKEFGKTYIFIMGQRGLQVCYYVV